MMHLIAADQDSTLILDEPDIYLHPDLQHRLLNLIGQRVGQYFVATHSTEIINTVEPGDVLIVRPDSRGAKRIQGDTGYTDVYAAIGSSENAQFARLAKTKKVLYFEGKDARILSKIAKKQAGTDFISSATVTLMKTDGFANWSRVSTSSWVFENFFGFHIPVAAIFDRDYRCDDEVEEFLNDINTKDTQCRVLPFKEIENILLIESAVKASVKKHSGRPLPEDWEQQISDIFMACFEEMKSKTLSARIGHRISYEVGRGSKKDIATVSASEEEAFTKAWPNVEFKRKVVPGKAVFSDIAGKVQQKFAVTLTPARVIDELAIGDIHPEVFNILRDIQTHLNE
ncbi:ABC transporter, ATP-binding protein-related protein [Neorhizobium galegae bv. orientalis]|nr:ABC transporter, ATP-binding protein-related protein [Neorhizobium galegae bv. orientalis]